MFEKDDKYQFQTDEGIFYTGKIVENRNGIIKIITVKGETIILNEKNVVRGRKL